MNEPRLILYHKQSTSARTRFLRLAYGGICAFGPLPESARLVLPGEGPGSLVSHPTPLVRAAERQLGLAAGGLEPEPEFRLRLRSDAGEIEVLLARFTATDPPFAVAQAQGGAFIDLTQARGLPALELGLLRLAYELILG
jgi:hypothetical protein